MFDDAVRVVCVGVRCFPVCLEVGAIACKFGLRDRNLARKFAKCCGFR